MDTGQPATDPGQSLDSVARHRRTPAVILRALFERRHYVAAASALERNSTSLNRRGSPKLAEI